MNINVLTLFPEMFTPLQVSLLGRGQEDGKWKLNLVNFRDFSDRPCRRSHGGGHGQARHRRRHVRRGERRQLGGNIDDLRRQAIA